MINVAKSVNRTNSKVMAIGKLKKLSARILILICLLAPFQSCEADQWMEQATLDYENRAELVERNSLDIRSSIDSLTEILKENAASPYLTIKMLEVFGISNVSKVRDSMVIGLNNDAVKAMNRKDYELAIEKFRIAIKIDPTYDLARPNLAIAHNDYALFLKSDPIASIKQLHRSLFIYPDSSGTTQNLDIFIRKLGKDPASFNDRVSLGDEERFIGDFVGAVQEYGAALALKDDPKLREKLNFTYQQISSFDKEIAGTSGETAFVDTRSMPFLNTPGRIITKERINFLHFMMDLRDRIRRAWSTPEVSERNKVVVVFNISAGGKLANLKIDQSSGDYTSDQAALRAVEQGDPFSPLPGHMQEQRIKFAFYLYPGMSD